MKRIQVFSSIVYLQFPEIILQNKKFLSFNRFTIEEFSTEEYILELKVQVCLESGSACQTEINVFDDTRLPRQVCDFPPTFDEEGNVVDISYFVKADGFLIKYFFQYYSATNDTDIV